MCVSSWLITLARWMPSTRCTQIWTQSWTTPFDVPGHDWAGHAGVSDFVQFLKVFLIGLFYFFPLSLVFINLIMPYEISTLYIYSSNYANALNLFKHYGRRFCFCSCTSFQVIAGLLKQQCSAHSYAEWCYCVGCFYIYDIKRWLSPVPSREEYKTVNTVITGNHVWMCWCLTFRRSLPPEPWSHLHCSPAAVPAVI